MDEPEHNDLTVSLEKLQCAFRGAVVVRGKHGGRDAASNSSRLLCRKKRKAPAGERGLINKPEYS